jgi:hypothetical protein
MKIWFIKQLFMTKYFICGILLIAIIGSPVYVYAGKFENAIHMDGTEGDHQKSPVKTDPAHKPGLPGAGSKHAPAEKAPAHGTSMDETPHIHHFHKNRVKKLKRHSHYWFLSKVLLVISHLLLLFLAYQHAVH